MIEQSVFLWGLPLLLLPWILRLIKTQKPTVIQFSQSYLLKKVMDTYRPKKRKNPWWLILLRMLILLTMILLIAGILTPQLRSRGPMSLIILVDDSLYSRAIYPDSQSLWEKSLQKAQSQLSDYSMQTKVALVTTTGRSSEWLSLSQAKSYLNEQQASYKLENWNRVKGQLQRLLRKREHDDLSLIFIGDGLSTQPNGLSSSLNQWPNSNINIIEIAPPNEQNFSIHASAKANGQNTLLEIHLDGPNLSRDLELVAKNPEGLIKTKTYFWQGTSKYTQWLLEGESWKQGELSLKLKDQYNFDNVVYFNIDESNYQKMILLQHQQAEKRLQDSGYYLEKALKNLAKQNSFEFRSILPRGWRSLTGGKGDILVLHDPPFLSKSESEKIAQFTRRGGTTIIMSGPLSSPEGLQNSLGQHLPAQLKEQSRKNLKLELDPVWKTQLPRLVESPFKGHWLFYQLKQDTEVLMRLEDGSPFWLKRSMGNGSLHLMSSPFHIMYSDALIQNDILVLLDLLTEFANQDKMNKEFKLHAGEKVPSEIESILPILTKNSDFSANFMHPGIYEVQNQGQSQFLSCNPPHLIDSERLPLSYNSLKEEAKFANYSNPLKRIDVEMVILLLTLLFIEVFALNLLQKPNSRTTLA